MKAIPLERLLTRFRDRQAHLAVVVDEFGGNVGIVTLQHIVAEIIGDMPDEFGLEREGFHQVNANEFLVDGRLAIYEMRDLADLVWKDEDVTTVGGYVRASAWISSPRWRATADRRLRRYDRTS